MLYACDFLPHLGNGHNHGSVKAAQDCRKHWKAQREAKARGYVDYSPHREPALDNRNFNH